MSDGTYRGRWIDEVFKTVLVSPEVKVLLLAMGMRMDEAGRYSVPREQLAAALDCHDRKVTAKQKAAIDAGLLLRTAAGHRGRTAEFRATLPGDSERVPTVGPQTGERVPTTSTLSPTGKGADSRPPMSPKGADSRPPIAEKGCRQSAPQILTDAAVVVHDDGATVDKVFEDETTPSLRSQKTPTRFRAEPESADAFDAFWRTYPRRVGKGAARKAWAKAIKAGGDPEQVIFAARRFATDPRRSEADIKYTPHPATWLNAERWEDEPEPEHVPAPIIRRSTRDDAFAQHQALKAELFGNGAPPLNLVRGELA